jgi:hypothetical protein
MHSPVEQPFAQGVDGDVHEPPLHKWAAILEVPSVEHAGPAPQEVPSPTFVLLATHWETPVVQEVNDFLHALAGVQSTLGVQSPQVPPLQYRLEVPQVAPGLAFWQAPALLQVPISQAGPPTAPQAESGALLFFFVHPVPLALQP